MNPNSLVSIDDLSEEQILQLLETARYFEEHPNHKILDGKVVATLFFEPSTRTRLSFETAVNRLGGLFQVQGGGHGDVKDVVVPGSATGHQGLEHRRRVLAHGLGHGDAVYGAVLMGVAVGGVGDFLLFQRAHDVGFFFFLFGHRIQSFQTGIYELFAVGAAQEIVGGYIVIIGEESQGGYRDVYLAIFNFLIVTGGTTEKGSHALLGFSALFA